jgi:hypothetical protein
MRPPWVQGVDVIQNHGKASVAWFSSVLGQNCVGELSRLRQNVSDLQGFDD